MRAARGVCSLIVGLLGGSREDLDWVDDGFDARVLRAVGDDIMCDVMSEGDLLHGEVGLEGTVAVEGGGDSRSLGVDSGLC